MKEDNTEHLAATRPAPKGSESEPRRELAALQGLLRCLVRYIKRVSLSNWLSIMALALSGWVFLDNAEQSASIRRVQYSANALTFRPRLVIVRAPTVLQYKFASRFIGASGDTGNWLSDVTVTYRLTVANQGNVTARIATRVWLDLYTGEEVIRGVLRDPERRVRLLRVEPAMDFYPVREVVSGDTAMFDFNQILRNVTPQGLTLHVLLLYQNELGMLFDTYYWATYRMNELIARQTVEQQNGRMFLKAEFSRDDLARYLELQSDNQSSNPYSADETRELLQFLGEPDQAN